MLTGHQQTGPPVLGMHGGLSRVWKVMGGIEQLPGGSGIEVGVPQRRPGVLNSVQGVPGGTSPADAGGALTATRPGE